MHLVGLGPVCPLRAHPPGRFPLPRWLGQGTRNQTGIRARSDFFWLQKSTCKEYIYILHLNARKGCNLELKIKQHFVILNNVIQVMKIEVPMLWRSLSDRSPRMRKAATRTDCDNFGNMNITSQMNYITNDPCRSK